MWSQSAFPIPKDPYEFLNPCQMHVFAQVREYRIPVDDVLAARLERKRRQCGTGLKLADRKVSLALLDARRVDVNGIQVLRADIFHEER